MFEYCSAIHADPSYEFRGSSDYAIHDLRTDRLFLYSVISAYDGPHLQAHPPLKFSELIGVEGLSFPEVFQAGASVEGHGAEFRCVQVDGKKLMSLIKKDMAPLPVEIKESLETMLAEVF